MSWAKCAFMLYLLLGACRIQAAPALPGFFEAGYDLFYQGIKIGEMNRAFNQDSNGGYIFHSEFKTTGFVSLLRKVHIIEKSLWIMDDSEYRPVHYSYRRSGGKEEHLVTTDFDHRRKRTINKIGESVRYTQTENGTLDKLLYQLAIMGDLSSGTASKSYTIVDEGKIKTYLFEYQSTEMVDTPAGQFEAVKMKRHRIKGKRKTFFWCATELDHLPVKMIHIEKNGSKTMARLRNFRSL